MNYEFVIIGAGPAGLAAAIEAARHGVKVLIIDENDMPGGQLFLQTHKFFGSREHMAGIRGFQIGNDLLQDCKTLCVEVLLDTLVWGIYPDMRVAFSTNGKKKDYIYAKHLLIATGALEKALNFKGWTKPGVMSAGAMQNMMHVYRVRPGNNILVIGSGNVGLIVAYQLAQAGVNVVGVIEVLPKISGYKVHASKIRRIGIPIMTNTTIVEVKGQDSVKSAIIGKVDKTCNIIADSKLEVECDSICLAVGLRPFDELCWSLDLEMGYIGEFDSFTVLHDEDMETSKENTYVAGDVTGVEEASAALDEGRLVGVVVSEKLKKISNKVALDLKNEIKNRLTSLRIGSHGKKRSKAKEEIIKRMFLYNEGVLNAEKVTK